MSEPPIQLTVRKLLNSGDYLIPMYQRNYAWEEAEIRQLIRDVADNVRSGNPYHIGTLVVHQRRDGERTVHETIDGQQRLTTLILLACYLKHESDVNMDWFDRLGIRFECRRASSQTLEAAFHGVLVKDDPESLADEDVNASIRAGYGLVKRAILTELSGSPGTKVTVSAFADYLLDRVCIMRVKVPEKTDLNHYFEIMNNRGEQLEKHEVLKSKLMATLDGSCPQEEREANRRCIHAVWEACMEMERYLQMGFSLPARNRLFGKEDWSSLRIADFDELRDALEEVSKESEVADEEMTLDRIINLPTAPRPLDGSDDNPPEQFNTIINFPNFLLQVLRVYVGEQTGKEVSLDDKQLIPEFFDDFILTSAQPGEAVKGFVFSLLRCKHLLDHYVLKREFVGGKDHWSLKRCKWSKGSAGSSGSPSYVNTFSKDEDAEADDDINRRILTLLSAFHVSTPTMAYKYWLNAALAYLFREPVVRAEGYLEYLESVARAFVFDRFLATGDGAEYFEMIHRRQGKCAATRGLLAPPDLDAQLVFGAIENNLVFNYLDYLIWLRDRDRFGSWDFTFRSSVEHFYPQTPVEEVPALEDRLLHCFGNLCLISHSKNSRLSNLPPEAKHALYPNRTFDSPKQRLMLDELDKDGWNDEAIRRHDREMKELLLASLH